MLRSAQRKSTGLSIPPRPPPSNLFGEHNQFLAAWGGTACALPVNGRLTLRQGACVQLVVEPMCGRLYLAVKAYSSGRRACRCATWCFNRCQVHVEISGNRLHPVPPCSRSSKHEDMRTPSQILRFIVTKSEKPLVDGVKLEGETENTNRCGNQSELLT